MSDVRNKNVNWTTHVAATNRYHDSQYYPYASLAVLMDIRDELQQLNKIIGCGNAIDIPNILRRIEANTKRPKRRKRAARA